MSEKPESGQTGLQVHEPKHSQTYQEETVINESNIKGIRFSKLVLWMSIIAIVLSGSVLIQDFFNTEKAAIQEINKMISRTVIPKIKQSDEKFINQAIYDLKHAEVTLEMIRETSEDNDVKTMVDKLKKEFQELSIKIMVFE